jgi:hypothetical protein
MKSKLAKFALSASIVLAMAFTFSCSSGDDNNGGSSSGSGGGGSSSLVGTTWVGGADQIVFLAGNKVEYTKQNKGLSGIIIYGTYTISGNDISINYKGNAATLGISYDETWVYELDGNTLIVKSATGNPNLAIGGANVGFKLYKQENK